MENRQVRLFGIHYELGCTERQRRVVSKSRSRTHTSLWIGKEEERGKHLFNEDCLNDPSLKDYPLIITEGELDCLTILPYYPRCVSVPNGANTKSIPIDDDRSFSAFEYLHNSMSLLKSVKKLKK